MAKKVKKAERYKYDDGGFHLVQIHAHGPSIVGNYNQYLECRGVPQDSLQEICNYLNAVYSVAWKRGRLHAIAMRRPANRKRLGVRRG